MRDEGVGEDMGNGLDAVAAGSEQRLYSAEIVIGQLRAHEAYPTRAKLAPTPGQVRQACVRKANTVDRYAIVYCHLPMVHAIGQPRPHAGFRTRRSTRHRKIAVARFEGEGR